jgi:hypothetical protein
MMVIERLIVILFAPILPLPLLLTPSHKLHPQNYAIRELRHILRKIRKSHIDMETLVVLASEWDSTLSDLIQATTAST